MKKIIISSIILCSGISFSISAAQPVENYRELSVLNQIATQQAEQTQLLKDIKQQLQNMNSFSMPSSNSPSDEQASKSPDNATGSDLDKLNDQIQQNIKEKEDNLRDYQSKHAEDKFKA